MFFPRAAAAVTFSFSTVQEEQEPAWLSHTWAVCLFQALGKHSSGQTMASVSSGTRLSEGKSSPEGNSSLGKWQYCFQETESPLEMQTDWSEQDVIPDFGEWRDLWHKQCSLRCRDQDSGVPVCVCSFWAVILSLMLRERIWVWKDLWRLCLHPWCCVWAPEKIWVLSTETFWASSLF